MRKKISFANILEMGPTELRQCRTFGHLPFLNCYRDILLNYYESNLLALKAILKTFSSDATKLSPLEISFLKEICSLRLQIREASVQNSMIEKAALSFESLPLELKAEGFFVVAMAFEMNQQDDEAAAYYRHSHELLTAIPAPRKAVKALHNAIAAESRLPANQKHFFISDYLEVHKQAASAGDLMTSGMALTNVAKEYHRLGNKSRALRYAGKAVAILEADMNSYNFHLSVLNLCHLLIENQQYTKAETHLSLIENSPFPDVVESSNALFNLYNPEEQKPVVHKRLPQNWILKLQNKNSVDLAGFSEHERRLIEILVRKPQSKSVLLTTLYGTQIDTASSEQRFKNLILRMRKKAPGIVEFKLGKYHLRAIA